MQETFVDVCIGKEALSGWEEKELVQTWTLKRQRETWTKRQRETWTKAELHSESFHEREGKDVFCPQKHKRK